MADGLVGTTGAERSGPAWRQAYRALDHGFAKDRCGKTAVMKTFPQGVQDFANTFRALQDKRHDADYDPWARFTLTDALATIEAAEIAIDALRRAPVKDRRAFSVWVSMKDRRP